MNKKFLIISSYAPPAISGSPLMMFNILKHFPSQSFCILTSHFGINNKAIKDGNWLNAKYFYFDSFTNITTPHKEETFFQQCKSFVKKNLLLRFLARIFFLFYLPITIVKRGRKIIKEEHIDFLLGYSDYGPALFATYLLHLFTKKPFSIYLYDLYYKNNFPFLYGVLAYFLEKNLFMHAQRIFVMSETLQRYYQDKYGRDVIVIHNSIDLPNIELGNDIKERCSNVVKIVFTGTIYWPQAESIKNLIMAIEQIEEFNVQLWLYTPHTSEILHEQGIFEGEHVVFSHGSPVEMVRVQKDADILFVPLSFNTKFPLLIDTSSPGKFSEYLISGVPILVHAPHSSYIAEYAKLNNCALVVDEENIKILKSSILSLVTDRKIVKILTKNAWDVAVRNHNALRNSLLLQENLLR